MSSLIQSQFLLHCGFKFKFFTYVFVFCSPDKQEWVTSIERAFSDGIDDDNRNLDEELGKEKSSELNISRKC